MSQQNTVSPKTLKGRDADSFGLYAASDWRLTDPGRPLSVAEQIAERISQDILQGAYLPGQRIIEQNIADDFHVSRGPVRDAIRILEREGVVEILPRRGAQITELTVKEVDNIFAIRAVLIELAVSLATPLLSEEELAPITDWIGQLTSKGGRGQSEDYVPISYHISLYISRRCQNDRLFETIRSMSRQTLRYSHLALASPERRDRSAKLWAALSSALNARDAMSAGTCARRLIEESGIAAREYLNAAP